MSNGRLYKIQTQTADADYNGPHSFLPCRRNLNTAIVNSVASRPALVHLGTQLIAKQDVYMLELAEGAAVPYEAAWMVEPADVGARLGSQGQPVPVDAMVCLVHCATHQRLAATHYQQKTDFGLENAVCAHTFVEHKSVRKMHRERTGLPFSSREHTAENEWSFQFGEI